MMRREYNRRARLPEVFATPGGTVVSATAFNGMVWQEVLVASWTASGSNYYYELTHGKGRYTVPVILYDAKNNAYLNPGQYKVAPKSGSERDILVITLMNDPGANRIVIGFG